MKFRSLLLRSLILDRFALSLFAVICALFSPFRSMYSAEAFISLLVVSDHCLLYASILALFWNRDSEIPTLFLSQIHTHTHIFNSYKYLLCVFDLFQFENGFDYAPAYKHHACRILLTFCIAEFIFDFETEKNSVTECFFCLRSLSPSWALKTRSIDSLIAANIRTLWATWVSA